MKKLFILILIIFLFSSISNAEKFESLEQINNTNWARYFEGLLGFLYDSHGCLHFTPSDIYLLYKTIPAGTALTIKNYELKKGEPPFQLDKVPYLMDITDLPIDIEKHALMFKTYKTELVVYPSLERSVILVNGSPYAQIKTLPGPAREYLLPGDFMLTTPTDPGTYVTLKTSDHYISNNYYNNTIVPFGAWIQKIKGIWSYQENDKWYRLPEHIQKDILRPIKEQTYYYYDVSYDKQGKLRAARYAGHDFGKYVLLWTKDGKNQYPELGYAAGELVYEQIILVKDLVHLLTMDGPDDFNTCIEKNKNFYYYKELSDFIDSKGEKLPQKKASEFTSCYKIYNRLKLSKTDLSQVDEKMFKAYTEYTENRLPRNREANLKAAGLYNYIRTQSLILEKQANWYKKIKADWTDFKKLRINLREDFKKMGILSLANQQNILEGWISGRLEFKKSELPKEAKYLTDLSFSSFFKPEEKSSIFTVREQEVMRQQLKKGGLNLRSVNALNDYNFGVLLNDILGDLYKSHGCMHVSPRNSQFLFELLPLGSRVKIYKYSDIISEEAVRTIPNLSDLVNFRDDFERLKKNFTVTSEVKIAVYPSSGFWIIYLKDEPFARLSVRGGPQAKMYILQGRDAKGRPIFEDHLAYPTATGDYYIFKKAKDYISNIYADTTIIPMGGTIRKENDKWFFLNAKNEWKPLPKMVLLDMANPPEERKYTYYNEVVNSSGETIEYKWGSHPFGIYALQISLDKKNPSPELIHSSGDLIMEERQLINDLIKVLSAPFDELEKCAKYSRNFDLYKTCYDFVQNPERNDLIQAQERAAYRLYFGKALSSEEASFLAKDVVIANKVLKNQKLDEKEIKLLVDEGIASNRDGKLKINQEKILGLQYDTYQYVVTIQKYAHHYATLKKHWEKLSALRKSMLLDFNDFVLKDPLLFHNFMRELMLARTRLEKLSQEQALNTLNAMIGNSKENISTYGISN